VVPINPKGGTIFGDEAVISIGAIDPPADLAVIVIRPDAIRDAMCEAADRGIRSLLILPGGFAEAGSVGHARDEALLKPAAERGLSITGPNCAGWRADQPSGSPPKERFHPL
jgi:acyl-CoA synthetase (NDP forming)